MNFVPELAAKVMAGEKTVTRRIASTNPRSPWWNQGCKLKAGRDYAVCPGRGKHAIGRVRITNVRLEPLGLVRTDEARREGFPDALAFGLAWARINGGYHADTVVWRIEFEALC